MDYIGGTKDAVALLNRLEKIGCLVSVYTKDHIDTLWSEGLISESYDELIAQHGEDFTDHLLLLNMHGWSKEIAGKFLKIFPAIENAWQPDALSFIFINLRSRTMIGFGLGNKGTSQESRFTGASSISSWIRRKHMNSACSISQISCIASLMRSMTWVTS